VTAMGIGIEGIGEGDIGDAAGHGVRAVIDPVIRPRVRMMAVHRMIVVLRRVVID